MSLIKLFGVLGGSGGGGLFPLVSPSNTAIYQTRITSGFAWAAIEYRNDGIEYRNPNASTVTQTTSRGNWLDSGTVAEVWIEDASTVGGAWNISAGTGRLQLNTTRIWKMRAGTGGFATRTALFNFYNAASGGDLIGTATFEMTAESVNKLVRWMVDAQSLDAIGLRCVSVASAIIPDIFDTDGSQSGIARKFGLTRASLQKRMSQLRDIAPGFQARSQRSEAVRKASRLRALRQHVKYCQ